MTALPQKPAAQGMWNFPFIGNVETGITAKASGTQANATQLGAQLSSVDTVVTAADAVKLPKIQPSPNLLNPAGISVRGFMVVVNNTANAMQLFGGLLDTINGVASATGISIPPGMAVILFAKTYTPATKVGAWVTLGVGGTGIAQVSQFTSLSGNTPLTLTGPNMAGAQDVFITLTATLAGAGTLNSATAAQIIAAIPNPQVGMTYNLRIINASGGAFAWTLTTATGITLSGTMSIAQNTFRDFVVSYTGAGAVTIQSVGTGTNS
jgi:hypothetical protein